MQKLLFYIISLALLLLMQEYILTHISQTNYFSIYVFILTIAVIDIEIPGWVMLLAGFGAGVAMDSIEGGAGIFAAATTWTAFVRPLILSWVLGNEFIYKGGRVLSERIGVSKFMTYTALVVLSWYIAYFLLDNLGNYSWILTPVRIVLSTIITTIVIYFLQLPLNRGRATNV